MSRKVDERIVSMRFDNKHFEENVKTTMSTLDKLKAKLSLKGSARAAQSEFASYRAGFISLTDSVNKMWASLEHDIANRMKNILKMFTIDPVKTGWNEYELKMGSIQTIMASTGESLETVNKYLNELNQYSDDTIYSFQDMTQNIGKFTNAGVKLEDAVAAIKGISNEAAISGANANEASRAMYNFAQALSAGYVKLIDWKSIELANMATVGFKEQLIETAVASGTLKEASDGMYKTLDGNLMSATKNFNETLQDQWMTSEVLITTLKKYADETTDVGKKATAAATEVKTFSQLMDTLKESAQSGWAQTWEILIGDFNEGKNLFTMISEKVGGMISKMTKGRNDLLAGALSSKWKDFYGEIEKAGVSATKFQDKLKEVAKKHGVDIDGLIKEYKSFDQVLAAGKISGNLVRETLNSLAGTEKDLTESTEDMNDKLEYFQKVVSKVWRGDYANGEARIKALEAAGYDYAKVQALVNKTVDGHKLTLEDLSEVQLKSVGYTDEQIASIKKLAKEAEVSGTPLNELINQMEKPSGRFLLIDSIKNACKALTQVFNGAKEAWIDIFNPKDTAGKASALYKLLESFHKFSESLIVEGETVKKITRTFKGLFAVIDLISTFVMGPIKIAFELLKAVLGEFGLNIWDFTAMLGDGLVWITNWVKGLINFEGIAKKIAEPIRNGIKAFKDWIAVLKTSDNIPRDIIAGIAKGIVGGIKTVVGLGRDLAKALIDTFKKMLGIHSPSTKFYEAAQFCIQGFVNGFKANFAKVKDAVANGFEWVVNFIKDIDWGMLFLAGMSAGTLFVVGKIANAIRILASPIDGLAELINNVSGVVKQFKKTLKSLGGLFRALAFEAISKSLVNFAIAVGILVAAVVALTLVDQDKLWGAVGAVIALTLALGGVLAMMAILAGRLGDFKESGGKALFLVSLGLTLITIAGTIALLGLLKPRQIIQGSIAVALIMGAIIGIMAATKLLSKNVKACGIEEMAPIIEFGKMFRKIAISLLIIALAIKMLGNMRTDALAKGTFVMGTIMLSVFALMPMTKLLTANDTKGMFAIEAFGKMFLKFAFSLLIIAAAIKMFGSMRSDVLVQGSLVVGTIILALVGIMAATKLLSGARYKAMYGITAISKLFTRFAFSLIIIAVAMKMFGSMKPQEFAQGGFVITALILALVGIMAATRLLTKTNPTVMRNVHKFGTLFLGMSASLLIIAVAMKIFAHMSPQELVKAGLTVVAIIGAFVGVMAATQLLPKNAVPAFSLGKLAGMFIALAGAILILTAAMYVITKLDQGRVLGALGTIMALLAGMAGIMAVTKFLKVDKGTVGVIVSMTVMMAVLVGALVGLSFIPVDQLKNATNTLVMIMGALAACIAAVALLSKFNSGLSFKGMMKTFAGLTLMIGVVIGVAFVLSKMESVSNSLQNAKALSTLVMSLAIVAASMAIIGKIPLKNMASATIVLAMLVVVMEGIALVLATMSKLKVGNAITNGAVLTGILLMLVGIAALTGAVGLIPLPALAIGALALVMLVGVLELVALVLATMSALKVGNAMTNGMVLMGMLVVLTGVAALAGAIGLIPLPALAAGALALTMMVAVCALIALVLKEMTMLKLKNAVGDAQALAILLGALSVAALAAIPLGLFPVQTLIGIGTFIAFASQLPKLAGYLGEFTTTLNTSGFDSNRATSGLEAIATLAEIANAIPSTGGLLQKFFGEKSLANFGKDLPQLAEDISKFVNAFKSCTFSEADVESAKTAIGLIGDITKVAQGIPKEGGWIEAITGSGNISEFGAYLPLLGSHIGYFCMALKARGFDETSATLAVQAVSVISKMAKAAQEIPKEGGWLQAITGSGSLSEFGAELPILATHIGSFCSALKVYQLNEESATLAGYAVSIISKMAKVAQDIPAEGGWLQAITGSGDMAEFGAQLPYVGACLGMFIQQLTGYKIDGNSVTLAKHASDVLVTLAKAAKEMPIDDGAWWKYIVGSKTTMSEFGSQLPYVGACVGSFIEQLTSYKLDASAGPLAQHAADVLVTLAKAAKEMPVEGAWWQKLIGEKSSLEEFGKQLPELATHLANFIKNLGTFSGDAVATTQAAVGVINAFAGLAATDLKTAIKQMPTLGEKLGPFAEKVVSFVQKITAIDGGSFNTATASITKLIDVLKSFGGTNAEAVQTFGNSLNTLGADSVDKFVSAFTDSAEKVEEAAVGMMNNFLTGAETQKDPVKNTFTDLGTKCVDALKAHYQAFYNAGGYLVDGFCLGITENDYKAEAKAAAMAKAAEEAAREALEVNSPSKVFRRIGSAVPEGFAQGIGKFGGAVEASATDMANVAVDGVKSSIANINDTIGNELDNSPTIRPVLDLTDVRSGANALSTMFGADASIGVLGSVNAASNSMATPGQNGTADDIVAAIKELGSMERNSYTIGGITYEPGSGVAEAIELLCHAALIERRT